MFLKRGKVKRILAAAGLATVLSTGVGSANITPYATSLGIPSLNQTNITTGITSSLIKNNSNISVNTDVAGYQDVVTGKFIASETPANTTRYAGLDTILRPIEEQQNELTTGETSRQKYLSNVDTAFAVANGRRSPYGSVGCAETVTYAGSYYSPALKEAYYSGIASVPGLLSNLASKGFAVERFTGYANKGDLLVYGDDDHVVIADGQGGCFGNSSSRLKAIHYSDATYAWYTGSLPTKIVRMS